MREVTYAHGGHELVITTELVDVTEMTERDPHWKTTDAAGHPHRAVSTATGITYPTLSVFRREHTCSMICEEDGCPTYWGCLICREEVPPGTRAGTPHMIPGLTSYEIDGEPATPEEARRLVTAWQREINDRYGHDPAHPRIQQVQRTARRFDEI